MLILIHKALISTVMAITAVNLNLVNPNFPNLEKNIVS